MLYGVRSVLRVQMICYRLVGDVLLCTGFLSYSGPFNQEFRNKLISNWQKEMYQRRIPFTNDLNLINMLVDNATVSKYEYHKGCILRLILELLSFSKSMNRS